jgi:hypothetical protein
VKAAAAAADKQSVAAVAAAPNISRILELIETSDARTRDESIGA